MPCRLEQNAKLDDGNIDVWTAASRSGASATAVILCFDCLHNGISLYVNAHDDGQLHSLCNENDQGAPEE